MYVLRKKTKTLSIEEAKLWKYYVRDISMGKRDNSVLANKKTVKSSVTSYKQVKGNVSGRNLPQISSGAILIDKKVYAKIKNGSLKPERTLDLHGELYDNAYSKVLNFVIRGHQDGKRLLLIITGKGKNPTKPDPLIFDRQRGVLKRALPNWLQSNQVKHLVLNVLKAHTSHGGEGAFYVYLRKRNYNT